MSLSSGKTQSAKFMRLRLVSEILKLKLAKLRSKSRDKMSKEWYLLNHPNSNANASAITLRIGKEIEAPRTKSEPSKAKEKANVEEHELEVPSSSF